MSDQTPIDPLVRLENMINQRAIDDTLAPATSATHFVSEAAKEQAMGLLRQQLRVADGLVRGADGRSGADHVKERLDSIEFAHFIKATPHRGSGLGPTPAMSPPYTPDSPTPPEAPQSFGDALAQHARLSREAAASREAISPSSTDMSRPFALRPRPRTR